MDRHYTPASLELLLFEPAAEEVIEGAVQHLRRCDRCWTVAAEVVVRRKADLPSHSGGARLVLLILVQGEERNTVVKLKAMAFWAELKELSEGEQVKRIRSVASLQSLSLFEVLISEARKMSSSDPHAAEQTAYLALTLAGLLPEHRFTSQMKRDLEGEALTVVANCRRLMADWAGSSQAAEDAERRLAEGSGDQDRQAMLLSIRSFLASDTGNFEVALGYSSRALELYRQIGDWVGVARTAVVEAGTLMASGQAENAIVKANLALGLIGSKEAHLELLARGIIIESYLILGRPHEALHLFSRARPLFERAPDSTTRLRVSFLEARLLDGIENSAREAEKLFKAVYEAFMDSELYKDAFVTLLTLFESQCRRGALDKAARTCQAAIEGTQQIAGTSNTQIRSIWQKLLMAIQAGQLQKADLEDARQFFVRYWNIPPRGGFKALPRVSRVSPATVVEVSTTIPPPPPAPAAISPSSYRAARKAFDRDLIVAALRETGGNLSEASRRLGMARMTLRAKIREFGLSPTE